ncbi:GIY-YIG nuclease family protein [Candidatus Peregrinibacteria bacterium]|nr:GIY-YIG nuclease family protein [Candidatus Peregrinibacteria bacterium]
MASVYFLFSSQDQGWYIGQTTLDPSQRLVWHNSGRVRSTKSRRPLLLAYIEEYTSRQLASQREWHLKHPKGYQEKLEIIQMLMDDKLSWPRRGPFGPGAHGSGP